MGGVEALSAALAAEWMKVRHGKVFAVSLATAVAFPLLIGLVMSGAAGDGSPVAAEVEQTVPSYLMQYELVIAIGGLIGFGFLFSWLFGREFTDGTVTDLLALPVPRTYIVGAKFVIGTGWCVALGLLHFAVGVAFTSAALRQPGTAAFVAAAAGKFVLTLLMVVFLSMPVAFVAGIGRGYMAPLGFVVLSVVAAQLLSAVGAGGCFPWAVPGLYSGVAGSAAMALSPWSLTLPFAAGVCGLLATGCWWHHADQV